MAQISYGTITITDTTDLTTYIRYATKAPLTAASQFQETPTTDTRYIAVLSIPTNESVPAWNSNSWKWSEFIGTDGLSVKDTRVLYYLKTNSTTVPQVNENTSIASTDVQNAWTSKNPTYVANGTYWTCLEVVLSDNITKSWSAPAEDLGLTQTAKDIAEAKSIAQQTIEDAQGAMSQAANGIKEIFRVWYRTNSTSTPAKPSAHVTTSENNVDNTWTKVKPIAKEGYRYYFYCEETVTNGGVSSWTEPVLDTSNLSAYEVGLLQAKVRNYWWDSSGAHIASGLSNGTEVTKDSAPTTYGYHALTGLGGISFGYNNAKVVDLNSTGPALYFYSPPTITNNGQTAVQGNMTMGLTSTALNFYDPNEADGTNKTAKATLNANGLVLKKGGIKAGTEAAAGSASNNGYIYLSSEDGPRLRINNFLPGTGSSDPQWRAIIGSKFGVLSDGTLYASNVNISGAITATSLSIGSGASITGLNASSIDGIDDYALQSSLDTEVAQRKAVYAVSTTGSTTSAKTTESNTPAGFVLYNGATVTIKFNNANSTTTPTLNVNNTGAKTIKSYTGATLTAAEYTWPAGAAITFTYDGSYWRMQDGGALQAKADAVTSANSASNSATLALNSASTASTKAGEAATSANNAANSVTAASNSAIQASNSATAASGSATAASGSATAAQAAQAAAIEAVDWTASIEITTINYLTNTATLKATAYKSGTVQSNVSYQWYQDSTALTNQISATLSNVSLDYSYTCIIS